MSKQSLKLQQRAQLIAILNKYRNIDRINNIELRKDIEEIRNFENKEFIFKTLIQEIVTEKSFYGDVCSIILLESFDKETFENLSMEYLQNPKNEDEKKFLLLSMMKQKGLNFNYRDGMQYIDDPEYLAHNGVKDFLKNTLIDPEIQLDLLDFYINIPYEEKICFLENLRGEFSQNDLANAFSILCQLKLNENEKNLILNTLLETNSIHAIEGLKFILENYKLETKTKTQIKKAIKKIQLQNPEFKNDIFTSQGKVYKCYIGFVDGNSNFSLVFSRKRKDKSIDALLLTANIMDGITSCMGFCAIPTDNFETIVTRLFADSTPTKVAPEVLKSLYNHYMNKTNKNDIELPYELIVWKNMLNDINPVNYDISEYINQDLEIMKLTESKVKKFASAKILETWYYSVGQNEFVDEIIETIEKDHIIELEKINEIVSNTIDKYFLTDIHFMTELQSKLLIQSYVASLAKLKLTSSCAYSMCFKNPYTKLLIASMIDKSIYYALSTKLYELDDDNMFKKNSQTKFTKEELEMLMAQLEEKWN